MIGSILSLLLATAQVGTTAPDAVPVEANGDNESVEQFQERWFGRQLAAMHEPPLQDADLQGMRQRFRLLVLPAFDPAYAYRLDFRQDRTAILHWTRLNGRGGFSPGNIAAQGERTLNADTSSKLNAMIVAVGLASLPSQENDITMNPDGSQEVTVCADGTFFVFEQLNADGRAVVVRSCGIDEESLQQLAKSIFRLKPEGKMK